MYMEQALPPHDRAHLPSALGKAGRRGRPRVHRGRVRSRARRGQVSGEWQMGGFEQAHRRRHRESARTGERGSWPPWPLWWLPADTRLHLAWSSMPRGVWGRGLERPRHRVTRWCGWKDATTGQRSIPGGGNASAQDLPPSTCMISQTCGHPWLRAGSLSMPWRNGTNGTRINQLLVPTC